MLALFTLLAAAQDQTGGIHGTVIDALTHQPIRKATLSIQISTITPSGYLRLNSVTDSSGAFAFDSVPAGQHYVTAQQSNYPQTRTVGKKVEVKPGEITDGVTIELTPGGAISGHVFDEDGDPLAGCNVYARLAAHPERGGPPGSSSNSDENGEYRLFHLAPGKYTVTASCFALPFQPRLFSSGPDPPPTLAYANQDYESAIEVAPGAERTGVDFRMQTTAITQVRGHFSTAGADWHGQLAGVQLVPVDGTSQSPIGASNLDEEKGTFHFDRVVPGSYYLTAYSNASAASRIGAIQQIEVKDKPVDVTVTLAHGVELSGSIEVESDDSSKKIALNQFNIQLMPQFAMGSGPPGVNAQEDGTFTLKSLLPMRYRLFVVGPGAFLKSAWLGSTDVSGGKVFEISAGASEPLKVTLSTNTATIAGTVPVGQVFFASNEDNPFLGTFEATPDQTGHFKFSGLAPGKYRLSTGDPGAFPDGDEPGQEVTVGDGETVTVDVKASSSAQ